MSDQESKQVAEEIEAVEVPKPSRKKDARPQAALLPGYKYPSVVFDGEEPRKGTKFTFDLPNGVTYSGIVADTVTADGNVLVEFKDGIEPDPQK